MEISFVGSLNGFILKDKDMKVVPEWYVDIDTFKKNWLSRAEI